MTQLTFDIALPPSYAEDDYLVSPCNQQAWSSLGIWEQQQLSVGLISGPKACGKSHLAHIWRKQQQALFIKGSELGSQLPQDIFAAKTRLVIDDCHLIPSQETLFHLLNYLRNHPTHRMLLTLDETACWQHFTLPDLRSRLQALPQSKISEPDDALINALLMKFFRDKQVEVTQSAIDYLLPRIERSFAGIHTLLESLDETAIAQKKPITRSLIQQSLTNY